MIASVKKKITRWQNTVDKKLVEILEVEAIPKVIELVMEDYRANLFGIAKSKSLLAPEKFEDEFRRRLEGFDFIDKGTPDMVSFDFSGELESIQTILEGISGKYVEVERKDYTKATKKQTYRGEYKNVYLMRYTVEVRKWEKILDKKFDVYPFSNISSIDIFGRAEKFVTDNFDNWIDEAIEKSEKGFK